MTHVAELLPSRQLWAWWKTQERCNQKKRTIIFQNKMGRLRKDYLIRQRSTSFQCPTYMFMHRHYLLGRGLLVGCSWQVGKGRNHPVTEQTCNPRATKASQLWAMLTLRGTHPLLVSSLFPTVPSLWNRKVLPSHQHKVSSCPPLADHLILPCAAKLQATRPRLLAPEISCLTHLPTGHLLTLFFPLASSMLPDEVGCCTVCFPRCENMCRWWF